MGKAKKLKTFFSFRRVDLFKRLFSSFFTSLPLLLLLLLCALLRFQFRTARTKLASVINRTHLPSGDSEVCARNFINLGQNLSTKIGFWEMVNGRDTKFCCSLLRNEVFFLRAEFNFRWVKYRKWSVRSSTWIHKVFPINALQLSKAFPIVLLQQRFSWN